MPERHRPRYDTLIVEACNAADREVLGVRPLLVGVVPERVVLRRVQHRRLTVLVLDPSMRQKRLTMTVIAIRAGHANGKATSASVAVRR